MRERRFGVWIKVVAAVVGLLLLIPLTSVLISFTARPLHPDPASVPTVASAAPPPSAKDMVEKARQISLAHLTGKSLPGLSVAVGQNGNLLWAESFGFADLKDGTPVTPQHRFRIGTASTAITAAAVGLLREEGRLPLDSEIQTYVPAFPVKQWPITLRDLMGHTAGIRDDGGDEGLLLIKHCERPTEALPEFANEPLLFQPGTRYRFSSYGYILMSAAIEAEVHQPFLEFVRKRIFDPLGMRDTRPDPSVTEPDEDFPLINLFRELIHDPEATRAKAPVSKAAQERATAYFPRLAAEPRYGLHVMRPLDHSCYAGGGVFDSTPSDLVRFGMAMQGGKLLQPATLELLQTPQRLASGKETGYGLGWYVRTVALAGRQTRVVGQDGDSLGGMVASLLVLPETGIVVAATSNIPYSDTSSLVLKIAEVFAEQAAGSANK